MVKCFYGKRDGNNRLPSFAICLAALALTLCFVQPRSAMALNCSEVGYDFSQNGCCFDFWKDLTSTNVGAIRITIGNPVIILSANGAGGWSASIDAALNQITFTPSVAPTAPGAAMVGKFCLDPNGASPVVIKIQFQDNTSGAWECLKVELVGC